VVEYQLQIRLLPIVVDDVIGDVTDDDSCRRNAVHYGLLVLVLINKLRIVSDCLLCVKLDHQAATDCLCCSYPRSRSRHDDGIAEWYVVKLVDVII